MRLRCNLQKDDLVYAGHRHVDLDVVWDVANRDLAPLAAQLERFVPEEA
jgi:uncharacterized protein with HEPN domain